jgi:pimeloyl-ACP methyl ester carboxylesterase
MSTYAETWADGHGTVQYFTRSDGSRLRYFTAGSGPALVLMHTIRTQLDYFHRVIPQLWDSFTVYVLDLPGMGWSDIVPGARYEEPELRAAVVEFVTGLDLHEVTLAGESLGGALALHASVDLKDRVSRADDHPRPHPCAERADRGEGRRPDPRRLRPTACGLRERVARCRPGVIPPTRYLPGDRGLRCRGAERRLAPVRRPRRR